MIDTPRRLGFGPAGGVFCENGLLVLPEGRFGRARRPFSQRQKGLLANTVVSRRKPVRQRCAGHTARTLRHACRHGAPAPAPPSCKDRAGPKRKARTVSSHRASLMGISCSADGRTLSGDWPAIGRQTAGRGPTIDRSSSDRRPARNHQAWVDGLGVADYFTLILRTTRFPSAPTLFTT